MSPFHKILRTFPRPARWVLMLFSFFGLIAISALGWYLRMAPAPQIFIQGDVYYFDPDCYSRMTRVQKTLEHPFHRIAFHDFENYPQGVSTHTTAPMDYAIAALYLSFRWFADQPLDMAGAFISPLLGLLGLIFLWGWSQAMRLPYRWLLLFTFAVSPMLVHGYAVGRPDHQSLILFFLTIAFASEWTLWSKPTRAWAITNGVAWGFALWTSLYEPLILFAVTLLLRGVFLYLPAKLSKKQEIPPTVSTSRIWMVNFIALAALLLIAISFDGIRIPELPKETLTYFNNWSHQIAELAPIGTGSTGILRFTGWLLYAVPILLVLDFIRTRSRESLALAVLVLLTAGLTLWEQRWGYFIALMFAFSLPWALRPIKYRWLGYLIFLFALGPMAREWDTVFYPPEDYALFLAEKNKDSVLLRDVAEHLVSPDKTPVLAPWWLCPAITYWSGQPCIAGSSHQSLPGIVDTARFYIATDPVAARQILDRRGVRYVVAYEPERALKTASSLLGRPDPPNALGTLLYKSPNEAPPFLRLVYLNEFFKVYEYRPEVK